MLSQDRCIDSEDSADSFGSSSQDADESVVKIFKEIFDDNIEKLRGTLTFINDNFSGLVWSDEPEKHRKTMKHSKQFVSNILRAFRGYLNEDVSRQTSEGSADCDKFQKYILKQLSSAIKESMSEKCFDQTKKEFVQEISKIIKEFQENEVTTTPKSDIDEEISKTDLMDPVHINHALLCCKVGYECEDLENPEQCLRTFPDKHWLSEVVISYQSSAVPKYVMARSGNVLYVAFRGLESAVYTTIVGPVEPHANWKGQTNSIIFDEAEKVPLSYFAREIIRGKRIIFTGHSTGAAIASLVAISLLDKLRGMPLDYIKSGMKCITFGMTPVGDKRLKKLVESIPAMKECFCHIVKNDDIMPKLFGSNLANAQRDLLDLVLILVKKSAEVVGKVTSSWNEFMKNINVPEYTTTAARKLFCPLFDIFGEYYVLSPTEEPKYTVCSGPQANEQLSLQSREISEMYQDYLVNHKMERYDRDVRQCLVNKYPEGLKNLECSDTKKPNDILPVVEAVQFENFGGEVVAKVDGKNMWFVHEVIFRDLEVKPLSDDQEEALQKKTKTKGKPFSVDISKNAGSVAVINMGSKHLVSGDRVNVKVKMHFQDSRHAKAKDVGARTTPYDVSKRQEQLAKLSPSKVIELAHLSAVLERRISSTIEKGDGDLHQSKRYADVREFFEGVISVVPVESIFHAMAVSKPYTVLQCCQLLLGKEELFDKTVSSRFLRDSMVLALDNLKVLINVLEHKIYPDHDITFEEDEVEQDSNWVGAVALQRRLMLAINHDQSFTKVIDYYRRVGHEEPNLFLRVRDHIIRNLKEKTQEKRSLCGLNMKEVYSSSKVEVSSSSTDQPLTLIKKGRNELNALSQKMSFERRSAENANSEMLKKLNDLRENFRTCSTLLGSFMEAHVHVPLELQDVSQARKIAAAAESGGLKVWMLLVLPFSYVKKFMRHMYKGSRKLLVDVSSYMRSLYDGGHMSTTFLGRSSASDSYYAGKLEFLMTSMKKSSSSNKSFIAYSLERQLVIECEKRSINHETPLDTILEHWDENFDDEVLTMVDEDYRPMIARWIKWSLMINQLRENLAEQTAVGVIGLVNSGKSKLVKSMFGIETISGTVAEKRTTVPYIYNLDDKIKGLDVIDFPGVDDKDKSIPELAKLLLSLTRIVVFVVEYKRAHTEATAQWLKILEEENVPVLVCLSFADKLFSEYMSGDGQYPENSEVKSQLKEQLQTITTHIGQSKSGKRDIEFVVFGLDNDSCLNSDEGKIKLRQAGLHDEIKVGRWIAEKLRENDEILADRVLTFITEKKSSVLHVDKAGPSTQKRSKSQCEHPQKKDASTRSSTKKQRKSKD